MYKKFDNNRIPDFYYELNNIYIQAKKINNKRFVYFYNCCWYPSIGEPIPVDDFEKILEYNNSDFENFINSFYHKYNCLNNKYLLCEPSLSSSYLEKYFPIREKCVGLGNSLSADCNLRCEFCKWKDERPDFTREDKEYFKDLYYKVLDKLVNIDSFDYLKLTEYGEPLLYIDENIKFFEKIKKKKTLLITTNGILLDKYIPIFERFKENIDFKIVVSINAYDSDSYLKKMGMDAFDKVFQNIFLAKDYIHKISFVIYGSEMKNHYIMKKYDEIFDIFNQTFPNKIRTLGIPSM